MPQSLAVMYTHLVFSTDERRALIRAQDKIELHAYIAGILKDLKCHAVIINSMPDHVHILFNLHRTVALAKVVEEVKSSSSKWIKKRGGLWYGWQAGYGGFSVSESQLGKTSNYIRNQEEHHKERTFMEEFLSLCQKHNLAYDEKYMWD